jgi:hypothetical protein
MRLLRTPAGFILYAFGPEDQQLWACDDIHKIEISECGTGFGIIDARELARNLGLDDDFMDVNVAFEKSVGSQVKQALKRISDATVDESKKQ